MPSASARSSHMSCDRRAWRRRAGLPASALRQRGPMPHCRMAEPEAEEHAVARAGPASGARKYHLLMQLGRGGTAVVHAALARGIGGFSKLVVLKVTRPELADHPEAVRMFQNEARVSARMNHPNVVQVYEVVEDQGLPVMVMEYLEGQSFAMVLRRLDAGGAFSQNLR